MRGPVRAVVASRFMRAARHALAAGIALAACVAQPQQTLRRPPPPGAVPLVSHLEPPLRIDRLMASVDNNPTFAFSFGRVDPLPAYVVIPARNDSERHLLQLVVHVAQPCFPNGPPIPTEVIRVDAELAPGVAPTRIELHQEAGARSTGTGVHVRVVGALGFDDLAARQPPPPALPPDVAAQGCVRDVLRAFDEAARAARARCDVSGAWAAVSSRDEFRANLTLTRDGEMPEGASDVLRHWFRDLPSDATRGQRIEVLCRVYAGFAATSHDESGPSCPWGERRRDLRGCDAYPDHDTPLPSAIAPLWP